MKLRKLEKEKMSNARYTRYSVDPYAPFVIAEKAKHRVLKAFVKVILILAIAVFSLGVILITDYARDGMKGRN